MASIQLNIFPLERENFRAGTWRFVLHPYSVLSMLAVGLLLTLLGPFGTFSVDFPARFIFWQVVCIGNAASSAVILALLTATRPSFPNAASLAVLLLGVSVCNAVPGALLVSFAHELLIFPKENSFLQLCLQVMLLTMVIISTCVTLSLLLGALPKTFNDPFDADIPEPIRGKLLALSSDDHYVKVYTDQGDALIHYSLSDAIAKLSPERGRQVHRSHWVATEAVARAQRQGNQWLLVLTNGLEVPVSRSRAQDLKAAGWLSKSMTSVHEKN